MEVIGRSVLLAPLTLLWSASGKRRRECPKPPKPTRNPRRGQRLSWNPTRWPTARRFFSWTVHGPFSFWGAKKRMGGAFPAPKRRDPPSLGERPKKLQNFIKNVENSLDIPRKIFYDN